MVAALGELTAEELSTPRGPRALILRVHAPGYGSPTAAVFEYRERYRRTREGWLRDFYIYEYRPQPGPSRRAHHEHAPHGVHQHCREAARAERDPHYEDRPRLLEEIHETFERLYSEAQAIRCGGLRPMAKPGAAKLAQSSAGAWKGFPETGQQYVERIRGSRRLARLHGLK